jgi:hypothetical protein
VESSPPAISFALQYGVPLKFLVDKFSHVRFEPAGWTPNQQIPYAKSILDYIFRWMGARFLGPDYAVTEAGETPRLRPTEPHPQQKLPFGPAADDAPCALGDSPDFFTPSEPYGWRRRTDTNQRTRLPTTDAAVTIPYGGSIENPEEDHDVNTCTYLGKSGDRPPWPGAPGRGQGNSALAISCGTTGAPSGRGQGSLSFVFRAWLGRRVGGVSVRGFCGDGGPASAASLGPPLGTAVEAAGNLHVGSVSRIWRSGLGGQAPQHARGSAHYFRRNGRVWHGRGGDAGERGSACQCAHWRCGAGPAEAREQHQPRRRDGGASVTPSSSG